MNEYANSSFCKLNSFKYRGIFFKVIQSVSCPFLNDVLPASKF